MASSRVVISPITRYVRSLPGEYYTVTEAAKLLHLSPHTLRSYAGSGDSKLAPTKCAYFGKVRLYLYTAEDVSRIKNELDARREVKEFNGERFGRPSGRPAIYTKEQVAQRKRLYARRHYYKKKAQEARLHGEDSSRYDSRVEEITRELRESAQQGNV